MLAVGALSLFVGGYVQGAPGSWMAAAAQGPAVAIDSPEAGRVISNVYQGGATDIGVSGSVTGAGLASWALEFGTGESPDGWAAIATGNGATSGPTLATWPTAALANGTYTLRVRASDGGGRHAEASRTVSVANFSVSQDVQQLDAGRGGSVRYTSIVPFELDEALVVKSRDGTIVRTLVDGRRQAGTYSDRWDGRDDAGRLVPDGPYFHVARVRQGDHGMTWDLTGVYLGNYFHSKDVGKIEAFDPFDNRPLVVTYTCPVAGNVTISVVGTNLTGLDCDQPGNKALCLVNRRYEESGVHTFAWAGVDAAGVYRAPDFSLISVTTVRDRFSKNAVVVFGTKPTVQNVRVDPPVLSPGPPGTVVSFDLATLESQPADITVSFLNQASGSTLRRILVPGQVPGHVAVPWDGRADVGTPVAPGSYTITVTAVDRIGNRVEGQILATVRR